MIEIIKDWKQIKNVYRVIHVTHVLFPVLTTEKLVEFISKDWLSHKKTRKHIVFHVPENIYTKYKNQFDNLENIKNPKYIFYIQLQKQNRKEVEDRTRRIIPKGMVSSETIDAALKRISKGVDTDSGMW